MRISSKFENSDIRCDECNKIEKEIYRIETKSSKNIILCTNCFIGLKREISEMWVSEL